VAQIPPALKERAGKSGQTRSLKGGGARRRRRHRRRASGKTRIESSRLPGKERKVRSAVPSVLPSQAVIVDRCLSRKRKASHALRRAASSVTNTGGGDHAVEPCNELSGKGESSGGPGIGGVGRNADVVDKPTIQKNPARQSIPPLSRTKCARECGPFVTIEEWNYPCLDHEVCQDDLMNPDNYATVTRCIECGRVPDFLTEDDFPLFEFDWSGRNTPDNQDRAKGGSTIEYTTGEDENPSQLMSSRLPKCNGGARWWAQAGRKSAVECNGTSPPDCESDSSSRAQIYTQRRILDEKELF